MERILVCIDGSQYALSCCEYAAWIASRVPARIELSYVTDLRQFEIPFVADLSGSLGIQPYQSVMSELQGLEERKAEAILSQGESVLRKSGYEKEIAKTYRTGFLVDSIGELEESSDMVVIGKRGENLNFATEHLGSTMERVVRASKKPCFVASRSFRQPKKVVFAYEPVPSCDEALEYIATSPLLWDMELHLINVAASEEEKDALHALNDAEKRLQDAGLSPICQMLHGIAPQEIARYIKDSEADLLVMGAYGHSRLRHLFLGSSTTEMLRDCRLPTLLFR